MKDKKKKKINNKGFTLVELLATISILAIIMLIAIPNVVGVVQKSRNKTYVEDAKKMISLAKYKVKSDVKIKNALGNGSVCISLKYLDSGKEIKDAPNGGEYDTEKSYVLVEKNYDNSYYYSVQLLENDKDSNIQGLNEISSEVLSNDNSYKNVNNSITYPESCYGTKF